MSLLLVRFFCSVSLLLKLISDSESESSLGSGMFSGKGTPELSICILLMKFSKESCGFNPPSFTLIKFSISPFFNLSRQFLGHVPCAWARSC